MSVNRFHHRHHSACRFVDSFPLHTQSRACRLISFAISLPPALKFLSDLKLFQFDSIIVFKHIDFVWKMLFKWHEKFHLFSIHISHIHAAAAESLVNHFLYFGETRSVTSTRSQTPCGSRVRKERTGNPLMGAASR